MVQKKKITFYLLSLVFAAVYAAAVGDAIATEPPHEKFRINALPGLAQTIDFNQYAGLLEVDPKNNGKIFFWLCEAQNSPETAPLIIWFTGGAGCSSLGGLFLEIGPFRIQQDSSFRINPYSWNQRANVLFVDQPAGVGFSKTDRNPPVAKGEELEQISGQFYAFLQKFLTEFPEYRKRGVILSGESFAGNYIPHYAAYIMNKNREGGEKVHLQGLVIGDGWVHPYYHYLSYPDYAFGLGLIDGVQRDELRKVVESNKDKILAGELVDDVFGVLPTIRMTAGNGAVKVDTDDIRRYVTYDGMGAPGTPLEVPSLAQYLNWNPANDTLDLKDRCPQSVKEALHAQESKNDWTFCNGPVIGSLQPVINAPTYKLLPGLLKEVPILFYSGQYDMVVNHIGTRMMIDSIDWPGKDSYQKAKYKAWSYNNTPVGYTKSFSNLTFVMVLDVGHMGPYDEPARFQDMINRFLTGKGF